MVRKGDRHISIKYLKTLEFLNETDLSSIDFCSILFWKETVQWWQQGPLHVSGTFQENLSDLKCTHLPLTFI